MVQVHGLAMFAITVGNACSQPEGLMNLEACDETFGHMDVQQHVQNSIHYVYKYIYIYIYIVYPLGPMGPCFENSHKLCLN